MPTLTAITGHLYDAQGNVIARGQLSITLQQDMVSVDSFKIAPFSVIVDLLVTAGYVDVSLSPTVGASPAGLAYFAEYDPTPDDTSLPPRQKDGYWSNYWVLPNVVSVTLGTFQQALRGQATTTYLVAGTTFTNEQIAAGAGIVYSKLNLTASIVDADVASGAAIAWSKVSKSGSSLADLATRSASDLTAGTVASARLPIIGTSPSTRGAAYVDGTTIVKDVNGMISSIGAAPSGAIMGDLSGTLPTPTVVAIRGVPVDSGLAAALTTTGQPLSWDQSAGKFVAGAAVSAPDALLLIHTVPQANLGTGADGSGLHFLSDNQTYLNPVPTGSGQLYFGATAPAGYFICDGAWASRTTFSALFAVIGTTYGVGDGTTSFSLPDLRQRFPLGKAATGTGSTRGSAGGSIDHVHSVPTHVHAYTDIVNHQHAVVVNDPQHSHAIVTQADAGGLDRIQSFSADTVTPSTIPAGSNTIQPAATGITASTNYPPGGVSVGTTATQTAANTGSNNPPYLTINFIIKY